MATHARYEEIKEELPAIKQLFQSRHYEQCASRCEHLLSQTNDEIHPIHLAYLNFYLALSHDTMAREAGMRNRIAELDLAEKYYLAAVAALIPSAPHNSEDTPDDLSPLSSDGGHGSFSRRASDAVSIASEHSISTQATSVGGDDNDSGPVDGMGEGKGSDELISSLPSLTLHIGKTRSKPSPIAISTALSHQHSQTTHLSPSAVSFVTMLHSHLASVLDLKDRSTTSTQQYAFYRLRAWTTASRPNSRDANSGEPRSVWERVRKERKSMVFRPRFDGTEVRRLCGEVLAEL